MDEEFKENMISNTTTSYKLGGGQNFISKKLDEEFISVFSENIDTLDSFNDPFARKIVKSIDENRRLNFPISNHELFFCRSVRDPLRLLKYLTFRYKFYLASTEKRVFDVPPYLLIEPVSACNLRCPMCFQVDKTFTRKPFMGIMKWNLFTRLIDEADELGIGAVTLASRGEPTMHPRYCEMLSYVSTKENIFELKSNTNATFLNEKMCHQIFESDVNTLVISADHYEKDHYEELRKGADFEKVVRNVAMLHNIREKHYPDSITEIRVSGVDFHKNLDIQKFEKFWGNYSDNVSVGLPIERWDTYNNKPDKDNNTPCSFLWDRMYVWFDGICNPCDADYKSYLSYGNVNDDSIKNIWNSSKLSEFRQKHLNNQRKSLTPCDRCGIEFC